MAAAVADYTAAGGPAAHKIEKGDGLTLSLERTPDILAELGARRGDAPTPVLVGFAAETGDPTARAARKLAAKQVDLIVANDVSEEGAGFDVPTNRVTLVSAQGAEPLPLMSKTDVAAAVLDRVEALLAGRPAPAASR
jgi:phosphopantothenoylcysteine decarboxylase/phosphopantothenate--cysteine ligase